MVISDSDWEKMCQEAKVASENAYVPYSHFAVGASLCTASGDIFSGCNIENASFGLTNCAERTALFKAVSEGQEQIVAMVVYGQTRQPISPCGACRQVMTEFMTADSPVRLVGKDGQYRQLTVAELLPYAFIDLL